jgi:hypothetical protein
MPARFLEHLAARLAEHDRAADGVGLEKDTRWATLSRAAASLARRVGELSRAAQRDIAQNRGVHQLVDETDLERALPANVATLEDHRERFLQPD